MSLTNPSKIPEKTAAARSTESEKEAGFTQHPRSNILETVFEAERRQRAMATIQDDDERMLMRIGYKQVRINL